MGMYAFPLFVLTEVRQRFKKKRESEIVRKNGVFIHMDVYRERFMRSMGMREGFDKRIANENMGSTNLGEEKKMGKVQEA